MDTLTGASQNFFVLIASFAFTLFAAARAVDSIRDFHKSPEDLKHLNLMLFQAVVILIIAIMPLVLSDLSQCIKFCSYLAFILTFGLLVHLVVEFIKGRIRFFYKFISLIIVVLSIIACLTYLMNAIVFGSVLIYRLLLLIGFLLLCFRYYLVLGHFIEYSKNFQKEAEK